jgi:hypothetical protein
MAHSRSLLSTKEHYLFGHGVASISSYPNYQNHAKAKDNDQCPSYVQAMDEEDDPIRKI